MFDDIKALPSLPYAERKLLPPVSAVYFLIGPDGPRRIGNSVLYVGATQNLFARWRGHSLNGAIKAWGSQREMIIAWIEVEPERRRDVELEALIKYGPRYSNDMYALPARRKANPSLYERPTRIETEDDRLTDPAESYIKYGIRTKNKIEKCVILSAENVVACMEREGVECGRFTRSSAFHSIAMFPRKHYICIPMVYFTKQSGLLARNLVFLLHARRNWCYGFNRSLEITSHTSLAPSKYPPGIAPPDGQ